MALPQGNKHQTRVETLLQQCTGKMMQFLKYTVQMMLEGPLAWFQDLNMKLKASSLIFQRNECSLFCKTRFGSGVENPSLQQPATQYYSATEIMLY